MLRITADKCASAEASKSFKKAQAAKDEWRSRVTNRALEEELRLFISRPENRDVILNEVKDVYDSILYGKRIDELYPRELWCKAKKSWTWSFHEEVQELICRGRHENALRIMMAKHGYIPYLDTFGRFTFVSKLDVEVMLWCEKELNKHDVQAFLRSKKEDGSMRAVSQDDYGLHGSMLISWQMQ